MTHQNNDNKLDTVMEMLIENGFEGFADVLRILLNEAMKIERDHALGAKPYEHTDSRKGYANGYKPKTVYTRMGRLCVDVPRVRGDMDFYPSALERGSRSERALKLAIAEMYIKSISTRRVTYVLEKMCGLVGMCVREWVGKKQGIVAGCFWDTQTSGQPRETEAQARSLPRCRRPACSSKPGGTSWARPEMARRTSGGFSKAKTIHACGRSQLKITIC
jgi:hypothetical protein